MRGYRKDTGEPMNGKLTAIDRDQIVALSKMGWSADRIASAFPVTIGSVFNVLAGRTWKTYEQQWAELHANDDPNTDYSSDTLDPSNGKPTNTDTRRPNLN